MWEYRWLPSAVSLQRSLGLQVGDRQVGGRPQTVGVSHLAIAESMLMDV